MSLEEIKFIVISVLSGFLIGFLTAFFGIKISKVLLVIGIVVAIVFYFYANSNYDLGWMNFHKIFADRIELYNNKIDELKNMLMKNIPLTIGIIIGAVYGVKKGL
jgi:uncharacterized membrane protein (Fun14 family)